MLSTDRAMEILEGLENHGMEYFSPNANDSNDNDETSENNQTDYIHAVMRDESATNEFMANRKKLTISLKVEGSLNDLHENPEKRKITATIPKEYVDKNAVSFVNVLGAKIISHCNTFPFEIGFRFNGSIPCSSSYIGSSTKVYDHVLDTTNGEVQCKRKLMKLSQHEKDEVIQSPFHYLSVMSEDDIEDSVCKTDPHMIVLRTGSIVTNIAATIHSDESSGETFQRGPKFCVVSKELGEKSIRQAYKSIERAKKDVFDFEKVTTEIERADGAQFNNIDLVCDGNGFVSSDAVMEEIRKAFVRVELDICTKYVNN